MQQKNKSKINLDNTIKEKLEEMEINSYLKYQNKNKFKKNIFISNKDI